jgi:thiamine-phosphate pyrophosphorylase
MSAVELRCALPPLYAILDPEQARGVSPEVVLSRLLEGGAKVVQVRAKSMTSRDYLRLARTAREMTESFGCRLIINDRADIALACAADGVHLGQEDLPLQVARRLLGNKIIGISTHDLDQAKAAEQNGADYIGFGPVFGTSTKDTGYTARGLTVLRQISSVVDIPIVAIGGVTQANIEDVWRAGAASAAVISDILKTDDIAAKVKAILGLC